ncbi:MAG: HEAT repeat domain-containing protein, partial [Deltaproteobacteria bacterium]|nr:HEAT repeat domain-containing protein [Deltaproteobacteria bacterium]
LTLVAGIAAVSAAAVTIVDFQFKTAAASVLQQNELAGYFGRFYGICGGIALAVQLWVTGRVLERYGILASLLPLPAGLALGSTVSAVMANPGLFVQSLAKGSDTIFRYTINDASMQLLYVPVPPHIRGRAKAFIDGILKPSAIALCGLALLIYKERNGSGSALTGVVLLGVTLWILLLVRARAEYVKSLVESLERRHLDLTATPLAANNEATIGALRTALKGDASSALHALMMVQYAGGAQFMAEIVDLLKHEDARVRAAAVERLGEFAAVEQIAAMRVLLEDPSPEVRAAALGAVCTIQQEEAVATVTPFLSAEKAPEAIVRAAATVALIRHAGLDGVLAAAEPLKALLAAQDPRDRAAAADALGNIGVRGFYRPLLSFLRDPDAMVRRRAIAAAGKLKTPELVAPLIQAFKQRETSLEAASALTAFGPGIEAQLDETLANESAPLECRRGCALVLGRLGTRAAAHALTSVLVSKAGPVRTTAARALVRLVRRSREIGFDKEKVEAAVREELAGARLSLAALKKLQLPLPEAGKAPRTPAELLGLSLLEERDSRVLQTLVLLEVLLPQVRLDVVAENLRSESAAARGNAIEVLDNALPEPWKRMVMAALDEVKRRSDMVIADPRNIGDLTNALVSGESGAWVAACTVRWMLDEVKLDKARVQPALREALKSPFPALREAAAVALHRVQAADAPALLTSLRDDHSNTVRRTVRALLGDAPLRAAPAPASA